MMEYAQSSEFSKRKRKITPVSLLESVLFANGDPAKTSLNDLAIYHDFHYKTRISRQAIGKRFNNHAVSFVKMVLEEQLKQKLLRDEDSFINSASKKTP